MKQRKARRASALAPRVGSLEWEALPPRLEPPSGDRNLPLSFRPFSSMVICSASSDRDSSTVWLPRSVWERRRLNLFIFSRELSGRGGLKTTEPGHLSVAAQPRERQEPHVFQLLSNSAVGAGVGQDLDSSLTKSGM